MHLEEITDKVEASSKVSENVSSSQQQQPAAQQDASPSSAPSPAQLGPTPPPMAAPALPPQLARNAGKSVDEILADLNKSPLFMTELEDNDDMAALEALSYEGTPLENATEFKESGNEAFKEKRWSDAREFYGRGIAVVTGEEKRRQRGDKPRENDAEGDSEAEIAKQRAVMETLYVNRAACHLEMKNYRSCWLDCNAALQLNPRNVKAWYRSAKALLAVGRIQEADDACAGGLAVDSENGPLKAVARDIIAKAQAAEKKAAEENQAKIEAAAKEALLRKALQDRGIKVRKSARPPEMGDAKLELVPDPENKTIGTLSFPTVLLYPVHYESDFIKAFNEKESLMQHFGYVFPLPWDREGEYSANGVECFMETVSGGLVRVGKKVPLLKVLSMDTVEVVDGVVKIYTVPKAKAEGWVQEFKKAKAKEKGTS